MVSWTGIDNPKVPILPVRLLHLQKNELWMRISHRDMNRIVPKNLNSPTEPNYLHSNLVREPQFHAYSIRLGARDFGFDEAEDGRLMGPDKVGKDVVESFTTRSLTVPSKTDHGKQEKETKQKHQRIQTRRLSAPSSSIVFSCCNSISMTMSPSASTTVGGSPWCSVDG